MKPSPFVKWAGGKSQLLKDYLKFYPEEFSTYYEPFLGGGAVFFHLLYLSRIKKAVLSDFNPELMNLWAAVKHSVKGLMDELSPFQAHVGELEQFKAIRSEFNSLELPKDFLISPSVRKAALLLYLNRTCFNGLYRVNSKGKFNVPFGRYKNPRLIDEENLRSVNRLLNDNERVELRCEDFKDAVDDAGKGDFVYFDPPYQPLSATSSFTGYTSGGFGLNEQKRLATTFKQLDRKGCKVMLSNSHLEEALRPLYGAYFNDRAFIVKAPRAINCIGSGRGRINELVILSYLPQKSKQQILR